MSNFLSRLFSKKTLVAGILLGAASLAAVVPSMVYAATYTWSTSDALRIDGSTTVYPITAAALGVTGTGGISTSGPYQNAGHAGLQAHVEQGGSGQGKTDCNSSAVDIGEVSSLDNVVNVGGVAPDSYPNINKATKIARDGICIVVNNNVDITNITPAQIKDIYLGNTNNWSTLGGTSQSIAPKARLVGSGTRDAIFDFCHFSAADKTTETNLFGSTNDHRYDTNAQEVAAVAGTPGAIGYIGIGYATDAGTTVKILTVNNRKATSQTVCTNDTNKLYPFSRYLYMLQNTTSTDQYVVANRSNANTFVTWMSDKYGKSQDIVDQQAFVRLVPPADITRDGSIDLYDLSALGAVWGHAVTNNQADCNIDPTDKHVGDGYVDLYDLSLLGSWWGVVYGTSNNLTQEYPAY